MKYRIKVKLKINNKEYVGEFERDCLEKYERNMIIREKFDRYLKEYYGLGLYSKIAVELQEEHGDVLSEEQIIRVCHPNTKLRILQRVKKYMQKIYNQLDFFPN